NQRPQMILGLHEGAAVSVAHGYAKASGRMMGTILHSNVGLLNGSMGIYNAWCDRVPMLILGATGPWDAAKRRPWIDWIHTASDQGALVRGYTKWDNQPASVPAAYDALLRAAQMATTAPCGPTYINLDAALQESKLGGLPPLPDPGRFAASCDVLVHRGFSMDYFGLPPVDVNLLAEPDVAAPLLLEACKPRTHAAAPATAPDGARLSYDVLSLRAVAAALNEATEGVEV